MSLCGRAFGREFVLGFQCECRRLASALRCCSVWPDGIVSYDEEQGASVSIYRMHCSLLSRMSFAISWKTWGNRVLTLNIFIYIF